MMDDLNTKPWYQSKTVWAGVVAMVAGVTVGLGIDIDQISLTEMLTSGGAAIGGLIAVYGRFVAEQPIKRV